MPRDFSRVVAGEVERIRHEVVLVTEGDLPSPVVDQSNEGGSAEKTRVRHELAVVHLKLVD